ncbi:MAG TPA: hypothetical protein VKW04_04155 [Planctomycetota bacterium]|nr:hypothetical protein [Planctomycetota bacterium]
MLPKWIPSLLAFLLASASALSAQTFTGTPGQAERTAQISFLSLPGTTTNGPVPSDSFQGLDDANGGVPPDTMGAVGTLQIVTMLNWEIRVLNRSTGQMTTVLHQDFWSALSPGSPFDPRIFFDPYGKRWIAAACAQSFAPDSAILLGVSQGEDATGSWNLYYMPASSTGAVWADFTRLGWNGTWITIAVNMEPMAGQPASHETNTSHLLVFNKSEVFAGGAGHFTLIEFSEPLFQGFSMFPVATYDPSEPALYVIKMTPNPAQPDWTLAAPGIRVHSITGAVGSEVLTQLSFTPAPQTWPPGRGQYAGPQRGSALMAGIDEIAVGNAVFRNGSIWTTIHSFLTADTPRTSIQWWQLTPSGTLQQYGRITDPSQTVSYGFPSLVVNSRNDVLIGYSKFDPQAYIGGNFAVRSASDAPGTLRAVDSVVKAGEAPYALDTLGGVRWGDFSHAVIDPLDDLSLWTIQEYASSTGTLDPNANWAVWWKRVDFKQAALLVVGNPTLTSADQAVSMELGILGYTVDVRSGAAVESSDAAGHALVVVSSTVTSADVGTTFTAVGVPVLCCEHRLFSRMGMVRSKEDEGTSPDRTSLHLAFPGHPLAAGLSGTVTVSTSSTMSWGSPNHNALRIARLGGNSTRFGIFAYDQGSEMPGLVAPARRVGFFFGDRTAAEALPDGWALFDAAVRWAVAPPKPPVLFVVGDLTLGPGDAAVREHLELLGYPVVLRKDHEAQASEAAGKSLVVVSSSVTSSHVNTKFQAVAVPVLTWESALGRFMGMTGTTSGKDYGTATDQTTLSIVNPAHPLAAGLTGTPAVVTSGQTFSWGVPNSNAVSIATLSGDASKSVIYGYDTGSAMIGLSAPARRVGFFLEDRTAEAWTADGQALFDAAVAWAIGPSP